MTSSKCLPQRVMGESTGNVHIQMYNYPTLIIVIVIIIIIAFYKVTKRIYLYYEHSYLCIVQVK